MAQATTCITSTITLTPGATFVLPPGSEIIGASDINSITSVCADLTNVEEAECYVLMFAGFNNGDNGATEYSDNSSQFIRGYIYNNIYTEFSAPIINNEANGAFNMVTLRDKLLQGIPAIVGTNIGYKVNAVGAQNSMSILAVKTYPSVAESLQVVVNNDAPVGSTGGAVQYRVSLIRRSDFITQGYIGLPDCP